MASSTNSSSNLRFSGVEACLLFIFVSASISVALIVSGDSFSLTFGSIFSFGVSVLISSKASGVDGDVTDSFSEAGFCSSTFWSSVVAAVSVAFSVTSALFSVSDGFTSVISSTSPDLDEESSEFCCAFVSDVSAVMAGVGSACCCSVSTFGGNDLSVAVV